ncbi:MAG: TonB-dependent receptor, partial [Halieaceae bacterium]|nr:TonB-dependent receptor [Halieaceae bacterium]
TKRNLTFTPALLGVASGNTAIPSSASNTSYAAYVHGNYRFNDSLELTAGVRALTEEQKFKFSQVNTPDNPNIVGPGYPGLVFGAGDLEYSDSSSDTQISPTVGLNYKPTDEVLIYAKYARGNQSGGWNGDYRTTGLDRIQFDPETVDAFEIGMKSTMLDGSLQLNADVFLQQYDDFQVFQLLNANGQPIQELTNAGQATSQGVELETVWLPTDALQLTFNATYLDATYDKFPNPGKEFDPNAKDYDGNSLAYAPEWKLFAAAEFVQPLEDLGDLTFHLDYSYQSDSFANAANREAIEGIPSFELWNARLTFRPSSADWQIQAYINNIADKEYIVNHYEQTVFRFDRVFWGAPRFFGVNFSYYL